MHFERDFLNKFGEEKTLATLLRELISIKMEKKEKIKYFNQHFTTILNKFHVDVEPIEALTVEYYTSSLHPSIAMFVKRAGKTTLAENFEEAKNVEKEMLSLGSNPGTKDNKEAR
jgi:hypothetical protein